MFVLIVYSLFILDDIKSSSNLLCMGVKMNDLVVQQAITIYQKSHHNLYSRCTSSKHRVYESAHTGPHTLVLCKHKGYKTHALALWHIFEWYIARLVVQKGTPKKTFVMMALKCIFKIRTPF